jgi:hypothetical protein
MLACYTRLADKCKKIAGNIFGDRMVCIEVIIQVSQNFLPREEKE